MQAQNRSMEQRLAALEKRLAHLTLQLAADVFPLSYSVNAMQEVTLYNGWTLPYDKDLLIIAAYIVIALTLASVSLSFILRRIPMRHSVAW